MVALNLIAFVLTFALADRFAGGGWPALDAKLPGRAAFWGAVVAAGVGYGLLLLPGALMALVWLIWRTPGWRLVPGASMTPRGAQEVFATFLRHMIPTPLAALVAHWAGLNPLAAAAPFVAFAAAAAGLAAWYAGEVQKAIDAGVQVGSQNTVVELARGAAFGVAVTFALSAPP